ncbi:MAG: type II and III secretion system protein [Psychrobacter sp.]|nr:type II and III secretion system protein [Psychrobacter sp.]
MVTPTKAIKVVLLSVIVFSTLNISAQAATFQTYVIDTYGGDALLPSVRQQLNNSRDGGTVTTYQDKLVLHTTAANYQAVQQLLTQIDGQPQALAVAVRVGNNSSVQDNIQQGQVIISNRGIQGSGIIHQSNSQQQTNNLYQVQTLSGSAASISTGTLYALNQTYDVNSYTNYKSPLVQIVIQQQVLLPTTQGITVTPRLLPTGQVEVTLSQVEEKLARSYSTSQKNSNHAIQGQRLDTTIIIPRGQWVTIGQISQSSQNQRASYGSNRAIDSTKNTPIWIMVQ